MVTSPSFIDEPPLVTMKTDPFTGFDRIGWGGGFCCAYVACTNVRARKSRGLAAFTGGKSGELIRTVHSSEEKIGNCLPRKQQPHRFGRPRMAG